MTKNTVDALFGNLANPNEFEAVVLLDDIEIRAQVREEFEDDENSLVDLGKSLRKKQLQAILLRMNDPGKEKPYVLIAGERRVRAARLEGLTELRALVTDMSEADAEDAQLAENIHRKNLTQIEEAKKIQRDLDTLGSTDAVLEKHNKSRAWLSKMLALLTLPEQTKRLVTENISADIEVINAVKIIEKADVNAAVKVVEDLKKGKGQGKAREIVAKAKDAVKPKKTNSNTKPKNKDDGDLPDWLESQGNAGNTATPKDRDHELPGEVVTYKPAAADSIPATGPEATLGQAYDSIFGAGEQPATVLESMAKDAKTAVSDWLRTYYDSGKIDKNPGRSVIVGIRNGAFSDVGSKAFALSAFLQGADSNQKYDLLNILAAVKA